MYHTYKLLVHRITLFCTLLSTHTPEYVHCNQEFMYNLLLFTLSRGSIEGVITRVSQKKGFFTNLRCIEWILITLGIYFQIYIYLFFWEVVLTSEIDIENSETKKFEVAWLFLPFSAFFLKKKTIRIWRKKVFGSINLYYKHILHVIHM